MSQEHGRFDFKLEESRPRQQFTVSYGVYARGNLDDDRRRHYQSRQNSKALSWSFPCAVPESTSYCQTSASLRQLPLQAKMVLSSDIDLLHPPKDVEQSKHKLKRLVQSPNSYFMDVKCQGCFNITTVFSHSQTVVTCTNCSTILCQPTGGKARLTEGCSFRRKGD